MSDDAFHRPDYQPPQGFEPPPHDTPPRPTEVGTLVAWVVIGLSVGLVIALSILVDRTAARTPAALERNLEFEIGARQILGIDWLYDMLGQHGDMSVLWDALNKATRTPEERVRAVPLVFEVEGVKAALARLAELEQADSDPKIRRDVRDLRALYTLGHSALSGESRQRLIDRHGMFAKLSLAQAEGGDPRERQAIIRPGKRMMIAVAVFVAIVLAAAVVGLVLGIIAIVWHVNGQLRTHYVPDASARGVWLEAAAFYIAALALGMPAAMIASRFIGDTAARVLALGLMAVSVLGGLAWPVVRGIPWQQARRGFGLHSGRGFFREIAAGFIGYVTAVPIIIAGIILTVILSKWTGETTTHPIIHEISFDPLKLIIIYALAALWAPVTEELMFRGAFFHHLRRRHGWWVSALLVAFVFAVIHPQGWLAVPVLSIIAVVLAAIREWRGSIIASITAHAINNTAIITLTVFTVG